MKSVKQIAFAALLTIGAFGAVTMVSCNKEDDPVVCPVGYIGANCQTKAIIGTWKGSDQCSSDTYNNITVTLNPASADTNSVIVSNPGGFGAAVTVTGTLSSDARTVTITNGDVGGSRTLSGTISLTSNTAFTFSYSVVGTTDTDVCNGNYTKQ